LFFVLSGFLIGSNLIKNRGSDNLFGVFFARRALRIVPLYAILIAVFYLSPVTHEPHGADQGDRPSDELKLNLAALLVGCRGE
jgi:peptidoglycan/LPS O-acetylase OafA/YrhL